MADITHTHRAPATERRRRRSTPRKRPTAAKDQAGQRRAPAPRTRPRAVATTAAARGQGGRVRGGRRGQGRPRRRPPAAAHARPTSSRPRSPRSSATSAASSARWPTPARPGLAKDIVAGVADQAEQVSRRLGDGGLDRTLERRPTPGPQPARPVPRRCRPGRLRRRPGRPGRRHRQPEAGRVTARTAAPRQRRDDRRLAAGSERRRHGVSPCGGGDRATRRPWPTRCPADRGAAMSAIDRPGPAGRSRPSRSTPTSRWASSSAA